MHSIYIPSKKRFNNCVTARQLNAYNVKYKILKRIALFILKKTY